MTGVELTHVPYKGSAPALTDVIGGHIALMFADPAPTLPMVKAGKVRALGVTSAARLPSVPTFRRWRRLAYPDLTPPVGAWSLRRRIRRRPS